MRKGVLILTYEELGKLIDLSPYDKVIAVKDGGFDVDGAILVKIAGDLMPLIHREGDVLERFTLDGLRKKYK